MKLLITESQYFAPVIAYKSLIKCSYIEIEQYEHWQKMSFRNRCIIAGANGLLNLSIPLEGGRKSNKWIREIKIDNSRGWQMIHWRTLVSAYNRSPWFEFYKDELSIFYQTRYEFLWNWNLDILLWTLKKLGSQAEVGFTKSWQKEYPPDQYLDLRSQILPRNYLSFADDCPHYRQVFEERLGFFPNLSIIDLLFCEGPNTVYLLKG